MANTNFQNQKTNDSSPEILVIGAGLAGLTAATVLKQAGHEVLVVEAGDDVGGRVRTDHQEGFLLDRGFQILLTSYPELVRHLDLDSLELCPFASGAKIFQNGKFEVVADPFRNFFMGLATATSSAISFKDKLNLFRLRNSLVRGKAFLTQNEDVHVLEHLQTLGFSQKAISNFFVPFLGGIKLDPELKGSARLSLWILKMLFTGTAALPKDGMQAIPNQLAMKLGRENIFLNSSVSKLEESKAILDSGKRITPSHIIIATEAPAASRLLGHEEPLSRPTSCVYFAAPHPPSQTDALLLNGQKTGPALNVAILTNVAPSYSSNQEALISAAIPGRYETEVHGEVMDQMKNWFGEQVDTWRHLRTYSIRHGQPDFQSKMPFRKFNQINSTLWICGDHRDTPSIQGAMVSGRRTAESLITTLKD
ncbi:FAD-dependent oxidoreductase [Acidimicrobiaceae bacterium]|nr:FAD-dependent oxidoreductase [Acidimicrobiaceae bacterium]|tara:strand:+ start:6013 stop:7278 length:1266 start_codon:yes stop_codon:yes gene_type:complete